MSPPQPPVVVPDLPPPGRGLPRLAIVLVVWVFVVVQAGAWVTSTNSGMRFATWPHADGFWLWPEDADLPGALEHGHRWLGTILGLLSIWLLVWVCRRDRRPFMRKLVVGFLAMVCLQGLLGGWRVLFDRELPVLLAIFHGAFAHLILCVAALLALALSPAWASRSVEAAGEVATMRRLAVLSLAMVLVQVFLGVVFRHTNNAYAQWIHVLFALVVGLMLLITIAYSMGRFSSVPGFARMDRIAATVLIVQILLGFFTLAVRRPKHLADTESLWRAGVQTSHVVVGGLLSVMATVFVARSYRNLVPRVGP